MHHRWGRCQRRSPCALFACERLEDRHALSVAPGLHALLPEFAEPVLERATELLAPIGPAIHGDVLVQPSESRGFHDFAFPELPLAVSLPATPAVGVIGFPALPNDISVELPRIDLALVVRPSTDMRIDQAGGFVAGLEESARFDPIRSSILSGARFQSIDQRFVTVEWADGTPLPQLSFLPFRPGMILRARPEFEAGSLESDRAHPGLPGLTLHLNADGADEQLRRPVLQSAASNLKPAGAATSPDGSIAATEIVATTAGTKVISPASVIHAGQTNAMRPLDDSGSEIDENTDNADKAPAVPNKSSIAKTGSSTGYFSVASSAGWIFADGVAASISPIGMAHLSGPACALAHLAIDSAALDESIDSVMEEVERLGAGVAAWFGEETLQPWIERTGAVAAIGLTAAFVLRRRAKSPAVNEIDEESSTWLFTQLQRSTT